MIVSCWFSGFTGTHHTHARNVHVMRLLISSRARMPADGISIDFEKDWTSARPLCARQDTDSVLTGCRVGGPDRPRAVTVVSRLYLVRVRAESALLPVEVCGLVVLSSNLIGRSTGSFGVAPISHVSIPVRWE